jgi:hypothetical protein
MLACNHLYELAAQASLLILRPGASVDRSALDGLANAPVTDPLLDTALREAEDLADAPVRSASHAPKTAFLRLSLSLIRGATRSSSTVSFATRSRRVTVFAWPCR